MNLKEIIAAILGKKISYYDGFSGSHDCFTVGYIENKKSYVRVFASRGKGWGIFIPKDIIPELIQSGKYDSYGEVERCSFKKQWSLHV